MSTSLVRVAKAHHPVTALGWGIRAGIWLQGCSIGCPGCLSRDTWPQDDHLLVDVDVITAWVAQVVPLSDGLTISGGEPFDQPEAVQQLARAARLAAPDRPIDVLVYSGRSIADLERDHAPVLADLDAVITEPFDARSPADDGWRGSTNQEFHARTPLGAQRGPSAWRDDRRLQVTVDETQVWIIGIPRHGDLNRMEAQLATDGIELDQVSWRP
jgi:anaerobic ribonucleoside-triphosphate reductase activating protein